MEAQPESVQGIISLLKILNSSVKNILKIAVSTTGQPLPSSDEEWKIFLEWLYNKDAKLFSIFAQATKNNIPAGFGDFKRTYEKSYPTTIPTTIITMDPQTGSKNRKKYVVKCNEKDIHSYFAGNGSMSNQKDRNKFLGIGEILSNLKKKFTIVVTRKHDGRNLFVIAMMIQCGGNCVPLVCIHSRSGPLLATVVPPNTPATGITICEQQTNSKTIPIEWDKVTDFRSLSHPEFVTIITHIQPILNNLRVGTGMNFMCEGSKDCMHPRVDADMATLIKQNPELYTFGSSFPPAVWFFYGKHVKLGENISFSPNETVEDLSAKDLRNFGLPTVDMINPPAGTDWTYAQISALLTAPSTVYPNGAHLPHFVPYAIRQLCPMVTDDQFLGTIEGVVVTFLVGSTTIAMKVKDPCFNDADDFKQGDS